MQALLLKGEKMKEPPKTCKFCRYYEELPFADEYICTSENSDYSDCPCSADDYCDEFEERDS